jgi:hypothetical protein
LIVFFFGYVFLFCFVLSCFLSFSFVLSFFPSFLLAWLGFYLDRPVVLALSGEFPHTRKLVRSALVRYTFRRCALRYMTILKQMMASAENKMVQADAVEGGREPKRKHNHQHQQRQRRASAPAPAGPGALAASEAGAAWWLAAAAGGRKGLTADLTQHPPLSPQQLAFIRDGPVSLIVNTTGNGTPAAGNSASTHAGTPDASANSAASPGVGISDLHKQQQHPPCGCQCQCQNQGQHTAPSLQAQTQAQIAASRAELVAKLQEAEERNQQRFEALQEAITQLGRSTYR